MATHGVLGDCIDIIPPFGPVVSSLLLSPVSSQLHSANLAPLLRRPGFSPPATTAKPRPRGQEDSARHRRNSPWDIFLLTVFLYKTHSRACHHPGANCLGCGT